MISKQLGVAKRKLLIVKDRWLLPKIRYPHLIDSVSSNILPLDLVMVSQIQRSGGTLLSQLLDGHSDLWVFPGELHLAKPKDRWPRLRRWFPAGILFRLLVDHRCIEYARIGYQKGKLSNEKLPFDYDVGLHCAAFSKAMQRSKPKTQREILDIYFSTFFGSWVNRRGAGRTPKYFCAFAADFAIPQKTVDGFFADYPTGKLVSVLRDPSTWTASALAKSTSRRKFLTSPQAIAHWRRSTASLIRNKNTRPENVLLITFADLIGQTEKTIRVVAHFLGVQFDESLLTPTFNCDAIQSNSSFFAVKGIVDRRALSRNMDLKNSEDDVNLYQTALAYCSRPR